MLACIVLIILGALLMAVVAGYARELKRLARFLADSSPNSNERVDVASSLPGCALLAQAMDARLESDKAHIRERIQEERRFQQDLVALSHDIRTPLAGAKGYVQLAAEETDPAEQRECLTRAAERLDAMQALLDQLFAYARSLDAESVGEQQDVDVAALLEQVLTGTRPLFDAHGMAVSSVPLDEDMRMPADAEALRRVLENVVRNAAEHGAGTLRITQERRALIFANGLKPGDQVDAARVFDRFYQADASRTCGNAGLGLATVANLCNAMGIQATAQAEDGIFTLRLTWPAR